MRSFWPASVSGLLALLAFGASTASSSGTATLPLPAAPAIVSADGDMVAALVPGNRKTRCAEIVLWRVGDAPKTIETPVECDGEDGFDGVDGFALGGRTALWEETEGGNNLELIVEKATLARPKAQMVSYVENGAGAAGDPGGDWTGSIVGHGGLLAYASWKECDQVDAGYARPCAKGRPDLYAQRLHVVGGRVAAWGPEAIFPIWTDGRAILVQHPDRTLAVLGRRGRVLWHHSAVPGLVGAVFQGNQLVTLSRTQLVVWKLPRTTPVRIFPLAPGRRVLEDVDGGIAVLGSNGATHLVRLGDGRGVTFGHATHAQLEPQGLVFASGAFIRFVPRAQIRFTR